jgi:hypothetical protein|tara:strand:- start:149 stop:298 length:150 start_codon:yes stop_codon:yes gene_type:complete
MVDIQDKIEENVKDAATKFSKLGKELKKPWVRIVLIGIVLIGIYNVFTG